MYRSRCPQKPASESLRGLDQSVYHAVEDFNGKNSYSLYPRTYEGAFYGVDLAQFGFRFLGDSILLYALDYSNIDCLEKVSAATLDSVTDSTFILRPVKTSDFYLRFKTLPGIVKNAFYITLVGKSHDEYSDFKTFPYIPTRLQSDSVCLGDTLAFTWGP